MFVPNFGNESRDFGFRTREPRRKFGIKSGLIEKRLNRAKNISRVIICLKIPFYPYQTTYGHDEFFLFSF